MVSCEGVTEGCTALKGVFYGSCCVGVIPSFEGMCIFVLVFREGLVVV